jgi:hypothetical protein
VRVPSSLAINALNGQSINGKFITTETYGTDCRIRAKTGFHQYLIEPIKSKCVTRIEKWCSIVGQRRAEAFLLKIKN